jgi:mycofactocin precursor
MELERDTTPAGTDTLVAETPEEDLVDDELLVEEISIDGMCGVY